MDELVDVYEYWSVYDDVSLFNYEAAGDDEFAYIVDLITKQNYHISSNDAAYFLFDDQHAMAEQYDAWVKEQEAESSSYENGWNGWDTIGATCDV